MYRMTRGLAVVAIGTALLCGARPAAAQTPTTTSTSRTTSTSTSTTTSTTLLPHRLSKATAACVHQARADFRACGHGSTECVAAFKTAFANCFAPGSAGVTCVTRCQTRENTCLGARKTTRKTCRGNCVATRRFDVRACHRIANGDDNIWAGGDAACLTTASANFDICNFSCSEQKLFCHNAYRFCIANCANL